MPDSTVSGLVECVGDPYTLWDALQQRVQSDSIESFDEVAADWLGLMWSLDAYRVASVLPPSADVEKVGALNRKKGNWFATLIALLLQNRTAQPIGARHRVQGFSQTHQIDVAWPARRDDPLVCAECKVTGAPATASDPARGAMSDWTNRRKELKFASADLKLNRRSHATVIDHWGQWRQQAPPSAYFLWAARLRPDDSISKMISECRTLIDTYLDGAGVFAWEVNANGTGYAVVDVPQVARVTSLDDVIHRIASEIRSLVDPRGNPPAPVRPA